MLKIILFLIAMFLTGYLIVQETWLLSIHAFGYEITFPTILFALLILIAFYLLYLIKKPFVWMFGFNQRKTKSNLEKREQLLTLVLQTILDDNDTNKNLIFKRKKVLFSKNDTRHLLVDALFNPTKSAFEHLIKNKETELAGFKGLYFLEKTSGNIKEADKLLSKALNAYPHVSWIKKEMFELQMIQSNWKEALSSLDDLYKINALSLSEYKAYKSSLLFMTNKIKEAYQLDKTNPAFAVAYAKLDPKHAKDILITSWNKEPSIDVYHAYSDLFKNESSEKRLKAIKKLISKNQDFRISLVALADTAIQVENWREAKETLEAYLKSYPLTKNVAHMLACVARNGWHHEVEAKEWEQKALETDDKYGWFCTACNQKTHDWFAVCPHCNKLSSIKYR